MTNNELYHHGILGMKWGVRRYQPYGHGGYERKDGKTGKVIGAAKSVGRYVKNTPKRYMDSINAAKSGRDARREYNRKLRGKTYKSYSYMNMMTERSRENRQRKKEYINAAREYLKKKGYSERYSSLKANNLYYIDAGSKYLSQMMIGSAWLLSI